MIARLHPTDPTLHCGVRPLRICIVYDRLYPWSVGGAERWYRRLAERLATEGHEVTYLTCRQWPAEQNLLIPGVRIAAGAAGQTLYGARRRRLAPVFRFGLLTLVHLLRHGRDYDVVHGSAMSSLSALAVAWVSVLHGYRAILDWWEVWRLGYWRIYLGPAAGRLGWIAQLIVARSPQQPIAYSSLHATRLRKLRRHGSIPILRGLLPPAGKTPRVPRPSEPLLVYAGRHIAEKQVDLIPDALALARHSLPGLRATIFGDGPDHGRVRDACQRAGVAHFVDFPGFATEEAMEEVLARALCLVLPSRREGFGLVVAEAAALGVPSVVLQHADSAATELIVEGVNGFICASADPHELTSAILRVHDAGYALRHRTLDWFRGSAPALTFDGTLPRLLAIYRGTAEVEQTTG